MPKILNILLLPLLLISQAHAKSTLRTICFVKAKNTPEIHYAQNKTTAVLPLPARNLSDPLDYNNKLPLLIGYPDPKAENGFKVEATIPPSDHQNEILLIFVPNEKSASFPYKIIPINGATAEFKPGSLLFINLSQTPIGGTVGGNQLRLGSKQTKMLPPPGKLNKDGNYYVNLFTFSPPTPRPLCKTYWPHQQEIRRIIFVIDDPKRKSTRIMGVPYIISRPTADVPAS